MQLFRCSNCQHIIFFDSRHCESCGNTIAYSPADGTMRSFTDGQTGDGEKLCENADSGACNWLVSSASDASLCDSCQLNRVIPNLEIEDHQTAWLRLESAKRRLVYSLKRFALPLVPKQQADDIGLCFDFLAESPSHPVVHTGHAQGVVTINIAEADPVKKEKIRTDMEERYRTLLGHFRHESGHYYWDRLVASSDHWLNEFRQQFGDERVDYQAALENYYRQGAGPEWPQHFVSAYASAHPWEDWAESWAHYFHLVDSLDTAFAFRIALELPLANGSRQAVQADFDPYAATDFDEIVQTSSSLALAVNSINRSMGQPDLYPFVLPAEVIDKLRFVHELIKAYPHADSRIAVNSK